MSYQYTEMRPELFSESGLATVTTVRANVQRLLDQAGAVRAQEAMRGTVGDSWVQLAALDYLVERGEIREITDPGAVFGQHRVFVAVRSS